MSSPCMWGSRLGGSAALAKVSVPPGFPWPPARRGARPAVAARPAATLPSRNARRLSLPSRMVSLPSALSSPVPRHRFPTTLTPRPRGRGVPLRARRASGGLPRSPRESFAVAPDQVLDPAMGFVDEVVARGRVVSAGLALLDPEDEPRLHL